MSPNDQSVPNHYLEYLDQLARMLGIAGEDSTEARWECELYKRKVLKTAIEELQAAWDLNASKAEK